VTSSRSSLFALLGLVLPAAAFIATPAMAATSSAVHQKSHTHHAATHKATPHTSSSVHHATHHATPHTSHKATAS